MVTKKLEEYMNLEQSILDILGHFSSGDYFDSHTIIEKIIENPEYHLVYLRGYSSDCSVAQYHGNIAKMIGSTKLVKQIGISKSNTIYGDLSDNMLWQKII